jgi:hypothetical protein
MTDGSPLWTLVSVVVGGALTMAGGWLVEWRKQAAEKKRQRVQKFEDLIAAVYEFDHWMISTKDVRAFGANIVLGPSPLAKVHAIAAAHFPQFNESISQLNAPISMYLLWMAKAGEKRLSGDLANINAGYQEAYVPYREKLYELLNALTAFAEREFSAPAAKASDSARSGDQAR